MPFERRFRQIIEKTDIPSGRHLWRNTAFFSIGVFTIILLYLSVTKGFLGLSTINAVTAWTAVVLLGLSMALSGICYFWNFADTKIIYRKHLGITGFIYGLVHIFIIVVLLSARYPFPDYFLQNRNLLSFVSALFALAIFSMMTFISNRYAVHELGGKEWRKLLRLGYVALAFTIIHFAALGYSFWKRWTELAEFSLPPLGLILFFYAVFVIILRIVLEIHVTIKKHQQTDDQNTST